MSEPLCAGCNRPKTPAAGGDYRHCWSGHPDMASPTDRRAADLGCLNAGYHFHKARADKAEAELAKVLEL